MDEETIAAGKRLRLVVDAWIEEYGDKGFFPRIGSIPSLAVKDLQRVLDDWEGDPQWAVVSQGGVMEDGFIHLNVHSTHVWEDDARAEAERLGRGFAVAWWDENGSRGEWRA